MMTECSVDMWEMCLSDDRQDSLELQCSSVAENEGVDRGRGRGLWLWLWLWLSSVVIWIGGACVQVEFKERPC
jgi:hypothetical protein